jgi:hypothetical protein
MRIFPLSLTVTYLPPAAESRTARPSEVLLTVKMDTSLQRKETSYIIGTVRNGYGIKTADAVTSDRIDDWVASAFSGELGRAGYAVRRLEALPPDGGRGLQVVIRRLWVEQDPGFWTIGAITDLAFVMEIYTRGQLLKSVLIEAKGDSRTMFATSGHKEDSLQKALEAAMVQAMPHVTAALPID